MNDLGMGDDEPAPQDTGQIVRRMEGAISDPFDYSVKPRKTRANTTAPKDNGAKSFGDLYDRSYEALHYRVDGDKPTAARDKQIEEDCKRRLAGFATMKDHAAIAVTPNSGCSWTSGQPTKQAAVAVVMNQCAKANVRTCSIAFAR